jgi:flagellar protein FlaG
VGLESISKAAAIEYSSTATSSNMSQSVQASNGAGSSRDYTSAQQSVSAVNTDNKTELKTEDSSKENEVTLKDIKDLNKVLNSNTVAEFGYYEKLNRITIKIKDKETGDVIKEIPSEKMLKAFTKACELAGLLVDEKR